MYFCTLFFWRLLTNLLFLQQKTKNLEGQYVFRGFIPINVILHNIIKMNTTNEYRQELRGKVIAYAMEQFYLRGIKAVKMDEISQGLHVSKRTVYEIFGDKEELLLAGMRENRSMARKEMEAFVAEGNHNVIDIISFFYKQQMRSCQNVGSLFYEEIHKMPRVLEFLRQSHADDEEDNVRFFEAGIKEGLFRGDVDYGMVRKIAHITMDGIMQQQLYKVHTMQGIFDSYFLVIIRGVCTERGLKLLNEAMG